MTFLRRSDPESTTTEAPLTAPGQEARLQLATRVAWMYFNEGLKQEEVAEALGINRMRVNRLLAAAREEGLVRVEIVSDYGPAAECELRLRKAYGLREAFVVPSPSHSDHVVENVGRGLGMMLGDKLRDGMTIGVHHGRSTHAMFKGLRPAGLTRSTIVALMGSLSPLGRMVPHETVARMALTLEAACYQIAAPSYARSVDERDLFLGLPVVDTVLARARSCDLVVLTASRVTDEGGLVANGFITAEDAASLRSVGAVGAVIGVFIDRDGRPVDHDVNRRRIGLDLAHLAAIPEVVLTGAGASKAVPLHAALVAGLAHTLVTDELTAQAMLAECG